MNAVLIMTTLAKLAVVGGVGIAITTSLKWFHTYDKKFTSTTRRGGDSDNDYDFNSLHQRSKSIR